MPIFQSSNTVSKFPKCIFFFFFRLCQWNFFILMKKELLMMKWKPIWSHKATNTIALSQLKKIMLMIIYLFITQFDCKMKYTHLFNQLLILDEFNKSSYIFNQDQTKSYFSCSAMENLQWLKLKPYTANPFPVMKTGFPYVHLFTLAKCLDRKASCENFNL